MFVNQLITNLARTGFVCPEPANDYTSYYPIMVAGQSNASGRGEMTGTPEAASSDVWMLANDHTEKQAYEPTDDATGQVDTVSRDTNAGHSFALRAAKGLTSYLPSALPVLLLPCALGGSSLANWVPPVTRYDRSTLLGSADYRVSIISSGDPLLCMWWYQGESNSNTGALLTFRQATAAHMAKCREYWGFCLPVIYVQLGKNTDLTRAGYNHDMHLAAEYQRQMETDCAYNSGGWSLYKHYMVVAFDLPLVDDGTGIHLGQAAQKTLGDRVALATRQHVLGEAVNGTGPRLVAIWHPGGDKSKVQIRTTLTLATISSDADDQFRVFDDGVEMTVSSVVRTSPTTDILITMSTTASGTVTVSYGDVVASDVEITLSNVVKDGDGLPLPQFGAQTVT